MSAKHLAIPVKLAVQQNAHHGGTKDEDSVISKRVAKALDTEILFVDFPPHAVYYNDILRRDYWLGWESIGHLWSFELMRNIRPNALVLDGIVGDYTTNGHAYRPFKHYLDCYQYPDKVASHLAPTKPGMKFGADMLPSSLFERIRGEYAKFEKSPQALNYFYILHHVRRNIASMWQVMYLYGHVPAAPYVYGPLFQQSVTIDPRWYQKELLQSECTGELNREVANLPSTRRKLPPDVLVDWKDFIKAREAFNVRFSNIREDVYDYFPEMRYKILGHKAAKKLRIQRASWLLDKLTRFSLFLDWLEYDKEPAGPVANGVSPFLRERMTA